MARGSSTFFTKGKLLAAATLVAFAVVAPVHAEPPQPGSQDYDDLMPYAGWIALQGTRRGLCCSVSDCRVVRWRTKVDRYEAFIGMADDKGFTKFPGAPNAWLPVPEDVVKRGINPSGQAIACWSSQKNDESGFYCFFLPETG